MSQAVLRKDGGWVAASRRVVAAGRHRLVAALRAAWVVPGARIGFWGMCLIAAGAMTPAFLPPDAPILQTLHLTWLEDGPSRVVATALVLGGVAVMLGGWLLMRPGPGRPHVPAGAWLLWALPVAFSPPLFSRDAYSYAAQGLIVDRGMDPYTTAPISVPGAFADQVDSMWLYTSAPYGPLALQTQQLIVDATFGNAYAAALTMRVPVYASLALLAWVLPRLADRLGRDRDVAVWLGLLNPLVVLHFIGGAHNDAMMIALVAFGLYLAADGLLVPASLAVAAGAGFKQTAVLALVGVAGLVARRSCGGLPEMRDYLTQAVRTGFAALSGFVAITLACGLGWGWLPNLAVPLSLRSLLAPTTFVGSMIEAVMRVMGVQGEVLSVPVDVMHTVGALVAVLALTWITVVLAPRHPVAAATAALGTLVACGPVVHPWYVIPPLAFLGVSGATRTQVQWAVRLTIALVAYSVFDVALANGVWVVGVTILAWSLWRIRAFRLDLPQGPQPGPDAEPGVFADGDGTSAPFRREALPAP